VRKNGGKRKRGGKESNRFNKFLPHPLPLVFSHSLSSRAFGNRELKQATTSTTTATKGLISKTKVGHVRYKSLCISLPFSTKQQRETDDEVLRRLRNVNRTEANSSCFHLELNAVVAYLEPLTRTDLDNRECNFY